MCPPQGLKGSKEGLQGTLAGFSGNHPGKGVQNKARGGVPGTTYLGPPLLGAPKECPFEEWLFKVWLLTEYLSPAGSHPAEFQDMPDEQQNDIVEEDIRCCIEEDIRCCIETLEVEHRPSLGNRKEVLLKAFLADLVATHRFCDCCTREQHIQALHHHTMQQFLKTGGVWLQEVEAILWGIRGYHYHIMQIRAATFQLRIMVSENHNKEEVLREIQRCLSLVLRTDYMMLRHIQPKYNVACNQMLQVESCYRWSKTTKTTNTTKATSRLGTGDKGRKSHQFIQSTSRQAIKDLARVCEALSSMDDVATLGFHLFCALDNEYRHVLQQDRRFMLLIKDCFDSSTIDLVDASEAPLCRCS
jgi:hypothetical protein